MKVKEGPCEDVFDLIKPVDQDTETEESDETTMIPDIIDDEKDLEEELFVTTDIPMLTIPDDEKVDIVIKWVVKDRLYFVKYLFRKNHYILQINLKRSGRFDIIPLHSCSFMIPALMFYEVNDPLLQVCYKP